MGGSYPLVIVLVNEIFFSMIFQRLLFFALVFLGLLGIVLPLPVEGESAAVENAKNTAVESEKGGEMVQEMKAEDRRRRGADMRDDGEGDTSDEDSGTDTEGSDSDGGDSDGTDNDGTDE